MSLIPPKDPPQVDRNVVIICATILLLAMLGLYGWVQAKGGSTTSLLQYLAVAAVPTLSAMASYVNVRGVKKDVAAVNHAVGQVQAQTNGNQSRLLDITEQAVRALPGSSAPDTPSAAPSSPVSAEPGTLGPAPLAPPSEGSTGSPEG